MSLSHDKTQELLPEYINGTLAPGLQEQVEAHCAACRECAEDRALLRDMLAIEVPDPGDLFWQTLPKKVAASVEPHRTWWQRLSAVVLRPAPMLALAASAVIAVVLALPQTDGQRPDTSTIAAVEQIDIPRETVQDVVVAAREEENAFGSPIEPDDSLVPGYQNAIASLNAEELDELLDILKQDPSTGGEG